MTDFHTSLDRALDPDPHNDWGRQDLTPLIEAINRGAIDAAMRSNAYAIRRDPVYDDSYLRDDFFVVAWKDPETPVGYDGFGAPLYPHQIPDALLAHIPAEGSE